MEIIQAKIAGFCFGVRNAVNVGFRVANECTGGFFALGPLIHNKQVNRSLSQKGMVIEEDISKIPDGSTVVVRAHGIGKEQHEILKKKCITVHDATCLYVQRIQELTEAKYNEGFQIVIVGNKRHPEVEGINGWCENSAIIIGSEEDAELLEYRDISACVVAQTTLIFEKWQKIIKILNKKFANVLKFDTICSATANRQAEAKKVSLEVDQMVVIGDRDSSNTQKLYELCCVNCPNTIQIEGYGELPPLNKTISKIGITAGASTPEWVIKEVIFKMEEMVNKQQNAEFDFKSAFEESLVTLRSGEIVTGSVIGYNNTEVFVDLKYKADGIISMEEFINDPDFDPEKDLVSGTELQVYILRVNDGEGNVLLSKKKVDAMKGIEKIQKAFEEKTPVEAVVREVVNGGVIAETSGLRVFIPASQISDRYVKNLEIFLKQKVRFIVTEVIPHKRRVVGSCRILIEEEKAKLAEVFWANIEIGKEFTGSVKSITDFGVFVDIGGVDGLIHVTELSWKKIKHPSQVMKVGDEVTVRILEFDREKNRISLGYKKSEDNPWYKIEEKYKVGEVVKGKVVRLVPFGAFVQLEEEVDGLVHISQISNMRLTKPDEVLEIGQEFEMKVMEVDSELKKISLSIKEVAPVDPVRAQDESVMVASGEDLNAQDAIPSQHSEEMTNTIGESLKDLKLEAE